MTKRRGVYVSILMYFLYFKYIFVIGGIGEVYAILLSQAGV
jgi:hypothetical protein